jgi:riboflavin kinase / FMN adenylyltransferase
VQEARFRGSLSTVVTFYPHPEAVLRPRRAPRMLTSLERKAELLDSLGVNELVVVQFDRAFAQLSAEEFCRAALSHRLGARAVFVGENFHFGHGGSGTVADLRDYGATHGFEVRSVLLAEDGGEPISSTRVRALLRAGQVGEAAWLLGRPHRIEGRVIAGVGRGRGLEAPTANLAAARDLALPGLGVYVTTSTVNGLEVYRSVTSIGTNRTFESDRKVRLETLILDFSGDLYGSQLAVDFLDRIRGQKAFPDADSLAARIKQDTEIARRYAPEALGPE